MNSELDFIRTLKRLHRIRPPVNQGIGDDGSVVDVSAEQREVVVTDMLLDKVHFDASEVSPELIGRKALAVNLSDLAAMGCRPTAAYVSLAVSNGASQADFLASLNRGLIQFADEFDFTIAGGDTNSWAGPFAINVTMTGVPFTGRIPLRSEARPGDVICVTGPLGGSLPSGRHLRFSPRIAESEWLLRHLDVHAMMDISDGLSLDLTRMTEASGFGAVLHWDDVPIHSDVDSHLPGDTRIQHACNDGEDFELLVTLPRLPPADLPDGISLIPVGQITAEFQGVRLLKSDGSLHLPELGGWQHQI